MAIDTSREYAYNRIYNVDTWRWEMFGKVQMWGNSLALRIPKHFADEVGLEANCTVEIRISQGALIVAPAQRQAYDLAELLAQITDANLHSEITTGAAVGNEVW